MSRESTIYSSFKAHFARGLSRRCNTRANEIKNKLTRDSQERDLAEAIAELASKERVIFHHPANVQILNRDRVKTSDHIGRNLVMKILATSRHFQMRLCNLIALFGSPLRSLPFARKSSLLFLRLIHRAFERARVLNFFAITQGRKTGDADIHADRGAGYRQRLRFRRFTHQQRVPTINATCEPDLFDLLSVPKTSSLCIFKSLEPSVRTLTPLKWRSVLTVNRTLLTVS